MMDKLITDVQVLMSDEYERAKEKFGPVNNSDHESYAIILEELEQSNTDSFEVRKHFNHFWELTTNKNALDSDKQEALRLLESRAILAACEYIQVAAMAYKAQITIENRKE